MKTLIIEIRIDYEKCIDCKKCVEACSYGVLEWFEDQPIVVNASECGAVENVRKTVQRTLL